MGNVNLTVRFFALYRERAGASVESFALPQGATVASLVAAVRQRHPNLAPPEVDIVVAVNSEYASAETSLSDGDEIALIPPVSGGRM